jgi:DNA invertase Pin-like site-specific DNA recombinase
VRERAGFDRKEKREMIAGRKGEKKKKKKRGKRRGEEPDKKNNKKVGGTIEKVIKIVGNGWRPSSIDKNKKMNKATGVIHS